MKKKICDCDIESAWFKDMDIYKCQYCMGALRKLDKVREIIDYNTPVNLPNREKVMKMEWAKQAYYIKDEWEFGEKV